MHKLTFRPPCVLGSYYYYYSTCLPGSEVDKIVKLALVLLGQIHTDTLMAQLVTKVAPMQLPAGTQPSASFLEKPQNAQQVAQFLEVQLEWYSISLPGVSTIVQQACVASLPIFHKLLLLSNWN